MDGSLTNQVFQRDICYSASAYELYVIGDDDVETVVNTIRGSEYRDRIRSISPHSSRFSRSKRTLGYSTSKLSLCCCHLIQSTLGLGLVQDVIKLRELQQRTGYDMRI